MKRFLYILIVVLLLVNLLILGYIVAKEKEQIIEIEAMWFELKYISQTMENFETDAKLIKVGLFYDSKKAKALFKRWYKGIKEAKKELKIEEKERVKSLKENK